MKGISGNIRNTKLRTRYYIIFVAREKDGPLRKIPIPLHYAGVFVAAAVVGAFTITGLAGAYTRMLLKTASFNQVRLQQEALRKDYSQLQREAHEKICRLRPSARSPVKSAPSTDCATMPRNPPPHP